MEKIRRFCSDVRFEMHENRKTFIVYCILRVLVLITMIRQFMVGNYEGFVLCILTLGLMLIPGIIQAQFRVDFPQTMEIVLLLFIFVAEILGEVDGYYTLIPFWDTVLHTINGFIAAGVGFSLVLLLNNDERFLFELSPLFIAVVAFCCSMTVGVLWEFFEFLMDVLFAVDMQKDTVITSISSVLLNPDGEQVPFAIMEISATTVNGETLAIPGYLDIGLIDTMEDLFVNFIGALVFCTFGYVSLRRGQTKGLRNRFLMHQKER